ncbi:MAG: ABC transporter substrate-binding protein [Actinobacteria bacterium]|nr:ABC transporter substrate-binding protein [Actinomycetota bacterium]
MTAGRTSRRAALVTLLALALPLPACTRGPGSQTVATSAEPVRVKVAYFEDSTVGEPYEHALPALEAFRLAILKAADAGDLPVGVDVEELDTRGDPAIALDLARRVAADASYVAAVAAPFWSEPDAVGEVLDRAGLLTFGLSTLGAPSQAWGGRVRLVAPQAILVQSMAAYLRGSEGGAGGVCLVGDGSAYGSALARDLGAALGGDVPYHTAIHEGDEGTGAAVAGIRQAGCASVAWAGFATGAAALRVALRGAGLGDVPTVAPDAAKTDSYLTTAGPAGEGTVVACACVDLSTSTELKAEVFIHDFQSEFGTPPGSYVAEAWDAAGMLLGLLRAGARTRRDIRAAIGASGPYSGLARTYTFDGSGEIDRPEVALFVDRGERWASL